MDPQNRKKSDLRQTPQTIDSKTPVVDERRMICSELPPQTLFHAHSRRPLASKSAGVRKLSEAVFRRTCCKIRELRRHSVMSSSFPRSAWGVRIGRSASGYNTQNIRWRKKECSRVFDNQSVVRPAWTRSVRDAHPTRSVGTSCSLRSVSVIL